MTSNVICAVLLGAFFSANVGAATISFNDFFRRTCAAKLGTCTGDYVDGTLGAVIKAGKKAVTYYSVSGLTTGAGQSWGDMAAASYAFTSASGFNVTLGNGSQQTIGFTSVDAGESPSSLPGKAWSISSSLAAPIWADGQTQGFALPALLNKTVQAAGNDWYGYPLNYCVVPLDRLAVSLTAPCTAAENCLMTFPADQSYFGYLVKSEGVGLGGVVSGCNLVAECFERFLQVVAARFMQGGTYRNFALTSDGLIRQSTTVDRPFELRFGIYFEMQSGEDWVPVNFPNAFLARVTRTQAVSSSVSGSPAAVLAAFAGLADGAISADGLALMVNNVWSNMGMVNEPNMLIWPSGSPITAAEVTASLGNDIVAFGGLFDPVADVGVVVVPPPPAPTGWGGNAIGVGPRKLKAGMGVDPGIGLPTLETTPTGAAIFQPLLSLAPSLKTFVVPLHESVCPVIDFPLFGASVRMDAQCGIFETLRNAIAVVMLSSWLVIALFIVLKA